MCRQFFDGGGLFVCLFCQRRWLRRFKPSKLRNKPVYWVIRSLGFCRIQSGYKQRFFLVIFFEFSWRHVDNFQTAGSSNFLPATHQSVTGPLRRKGIIFSNSVYVNCNLWSAKILLNLVDWFPVFFLNIFIVLYVNFTKLCWNQTIAQ